MIKAHTVFFIGLVLATAIGFSSSAASAFQAKQPATDSADATAQIPAVGAYRGEFRSIKIDEPESNQRSWETRPYQVAVWLCHDGSPLILKSESAICDRISVECQLVDPSGWNVNVGTPPSQWRWKLLNSKLDKAAIVELLAEPELEFYDKLMVVKVADSSGTFQISVREVDAKTRQLGPMALAETRMLSAFGSLAGRLVRRAFMPIARIDDVFRNDTAQMQVRGIEACVQTIINDDLKPEVVANIYSPCFVKDSDRFLPVVVRTDRSGNISRLDAVPFTFISIQEMEGTTIKGKIYSTSGAALAGRKSKRAEKLALVIRPSDGTTTLRLMSRDSDNPQPLEGYDVVTVNPDNIRDEWEYHGKTDWRGEIEVPKSDDMRMLLVRRGGRRLKKIPVVPGFRDELETTVTNDETRLLASGVVRGLENEILSLAVLRKIYQSQIEEAIRDGDKVKARAILRTYASLENPQDLKARMADEEVRLRSQTDAQREKQVIQRMFSPLKKIVSSDFIRNQETDIQKWIEAGEVPAATEQDAAPESEVESEPPADDSDSKSAEDSR